MYLNRSRIINVEAKPRVAAAILMAVGDIMLGEDALCIGHGVGSKIKKMGVNYPFMNVAHILRRGDIVFGNLEAVLSNIGIKRKYLSSLQLRAAPEAVEGLKYAGFNVFSLANNHALEHGQEALFETMHILSKNNIKYVGVGSNTREAREPVTMDSRGITINHLAYCLVPDKTAFSGVKDNDEICSDVRQAKSKTDIVVVSLHWGNEYIQSPSPAQIRLAHQIIDSGANLILGHHPHVLQGIEKYHNGVIAYSLGNFIFDMWQKKTRESMILQVTLSKQGIADVQIIPVYINDIYQPEILGGVEAELLLADIEKYSQWVAAENTDDLENSIRKYSIEAAAIRRWYRRGLKWYFIRHFYRYSPRFAWQLASGYLMRKLSRVS